MLLESSRWLTYRPLAYLGRQFQKSHSVCQRSSLTKTVVCDNSVKAARVAWISRFLRMHGSLQISRLYKDAIMGPQMKALRTCRK
jgi:hypothetical protein